MRAFLVFVILCVISFISFIEFVVIRYPPLYISCNNYMRPSRRVNEFGYVCQVFGADVM